MKNKKAIIITGAAALIIIAVVAVILLLGNKNKLSATTMRLLKIEGTVTLQSGGKKKTIVDNLKLNNGDILTTEVKSLAGIALDDNKAVTLEESSEAEFNQSGKKLDLNLKKGALFFDVSKKLEADESFEIRTSTMIAGIRGTSGYVVVKNNGEPDGILITDGSVEVKGINPKTGKEITTTVNAGQVVYVYLYDDLDPDNSVSFELLDVSEEELPDEVVQYLTEHEELLDKVCEATGWSKEKIKEKKEKLPTNTPTPKPTEVTEEEEASETPTPEADPTATATNTPTPTNAQTPPKASPTPTNKPSPTPTKAPVPLPTPTPVNGEPTPTTEGPTPTRKPTSTPTATLTPTPTPTPVPTNTPVPTPTDTPTDTPTPEPDTPTPDPDTPTPDPDTPTPDPDTPTPEPDTPTPEPDIAVESISFVKTAFEVAKGETTTISTTDYAITPSDATNKNVSFSIGDTSVATVNASGVISGVAAGSTTLTVTTEDGGKTAVASVVVTSSLVVSVLEWENDSLAMFPGENETGLRISPGDAEGELTIESSDESVIVASTVSSPGGITKAGKEASDISGVTVILFAKSAGTATLTAKAGGKSASLSVTVYQDPELTDIHTGNHPDAIEEYVRIEFKLSKVMSDFEYDVELSSLSSDQAEIHQKDISAGYIDLYLKAPGTYSTKLKVVVRQGGEIVHEKEFSTVLSFGYG